MGSRREEKVIRQEGSGIVEEIKGGKTSGRIKKVISGGWFIARISFKSYGLDV